MYKMTDAEFKSALRQAVIENASRADGPYGGTLPEGFKPFYPIWNSVRSDRPTYDREWTLAHGPYHFLRDEQRKQLLEEVEPFGTQNAISPGEPR